MCYAGKCLYCIKVETGTYIFAVINMIIAVLSSLANIICLVVINVLYYQNQHPTDYRVIDTIWQNTSEGQHNRNSVIIINVAMVGILLLALINFTFAVLLMNGMAKKKASHVKAYFVYSVIINIASYILTFLLMLPVIILAIFHTLILVMVCMTYRRMNDGKVYGVVVNNYRVPLVEHPVHGDPPHYGNN
ncbi:uncharacterized protein ACR2FA_003927 [Aphomia sociella]